MQHKNESSAPNRLVEQEHITAVSNRGRQFRFKKPLLFAPQVDDETGFYIFENHDLAISVHAEQIDDLRDELADQVRFLWDEYALEDDEVLSPAALKLKQQLLMEVEEVGGAEA